MREFHLEILEEMKDILEKGIANPYPAISPDLLEQPVRGSSRSDHKYVIDDSRLKNEEDRERIYDLRSVALDFLEDLGAVEKLPDKTEDRYRITFNAPDALDKVYDKLENRGE